MKCYVLSPSTFAEEQQRDTGDYNLVLDSMSGEQGSLSLVGDQEPAALTGRWLAVNGEVYCIDKSSAARGKTSLKLLPPDSLFDRDLLYTESNAATIGAFLAGIITSGWINQTDSVYSYPYITVTSTDTTPFEAPEVDDNGIYNLLDYIRSVRKNHGVAIHAAITGTGLALTIAKDPETVRPLVVGDGHTQLVTSDFSSSALAKITVYQPVDTGDVDDDGNAIMETTATDWYLAADGSVSSIVPQERAYGEWGSITIGEDDDQQEAVTEEFGKNESSRKIELFSDVQMAVGDKARLRIKGEVIESTVTGIYRKSGDKRTRYKLGDMITTLSERMAANEKLRGENP